MRHANRSDYRVTLSVAPPVLGRAGGTSQSLPALSNGGFNHFGGVQCHIDWPRAFDHLLRFLDFCRRAMYQQQEFVGFQRQFVPDDTVLWNAHTIEPSTYGTQTA